MILRCPHHFEPVEAGLRHGADFIPAITVVREWQTPHSVSCSLRGRHLSSAIHQFESPLQAFLHHNRPQSPTW